MLPCGGPECRFFSELVLKTLYSLVASGSPLSVVQADVMTMDRWLDYCNTAVWQLA